MKRNALIFLILINAFTQVWGYTKKEVQAILNSPEKMLSNYNTQLNPDLNKRVQDVPKHVLKALMSWDQKDNYSPYQLNDYDRDVVKECITLLPSFLQEVLKEKLLGIYFVNNLKGGGVTEIVYDKDLNTHYWIAFTPAALKTGLCEMVNKKEMSCFVQDNMEVVLHINCGPKYHGLLYILLHEAAHIYDMEKRVTPFVMDWSPMIIEGLPGPTPFVKEIWKSYKTPYKFHDFKLRKKVTFYGFGKGPKINLSDALTLYKQLQNCSFVSAYGSKSWPEDFAEYLTFFHLTEKLKAPYEVTIRKNGTILYRNEPMRGAKVMQRKHIIEALYQ